MNQILVATIIAVSIIGTGAYAASQVSEMSAASSRSSDLMTPKYFQLHQLSEMSAASSMSSDIDIEKKSEMSAASSRSSDIDIEKKSESMDAYFDDVSINIINTGKDQSEIAMFRFYDNLGDKDLKEVIFPELYDDDDDDTIETTQSSTMCSGNAGCITGIVTSVIDGDTIKVDYQSIRFSLASAPELYENGGNTARKFIEDICPVGSTATVDEDDRQTRGSYDRIVGVIFCNGVNLNEELVDSGLGYLSTGFCDKSEFASHSWATKHGCTTDSKVTSSQVSTQSNCNSSYPDFCIPSPPPDLNCTDIPEKRFTVLQPDPHRFDGDKDGIGCES